MMLIDEIDYKTRMMAMRKQMIAQMEQEMHPKEEDRMFYYHSSEDRIVLSHALFWVMTSFRNPQFPLPKGAPYIPSPQTRGIIDYGQGCVIKCLKVI